MYWNPTNSTQIPENQKPPKLRNSETPTQKLRKSEFLSFRGRVSESSNFGQFWRWRKKSKTLRLQWSDVRVSDVEGFPCREGPCRFQYIGTTQAFCFCFVCFAPFCYAPLYDMLWQNPPQQIHAR